MFVESFACLFALCDCDKSTSGRRSFFSLLRSFIHSTRPVTKQLLDNENISGDKSSPAWDLFWPEIWNALSSATAVSTEKNLLVNYSLCAV